MSVSSNFIECIKIVWNINQMKSVCLPVSLSVLQHHWTESVLTSMVRVTHWSGLLNWACPTHRPSSSTCQPILRWVWMRWYESVNPITNQVMNICSSYYSRCLLPLKPFTLLTSIWTLLWRGTPSKSLSPSEEGLFSCFVSWLTHSEAFKCTWTPSNLDTLGTSRSVLISGVVSFQELWWDHPFRLAKVSDYISIWQSNAHQNNQWDCLSDMQGFRLKGLGSTVA